MDPDVNLPVKGQKYAVSHPVEKGEARFESCAKGLELIFDMLDDLKIEATFFIEARTAQKLIDDHGLDLRRLLYKHEVGSHALMHEDFLGKDTGIPLEREEMKATLSASLGILAGLINNPIIGFRAPYIRINDLLASVLVELGFEYDSSITRSFQIKSNQKEQQSHSFQPYYYFEESENEIDNPKALVEVPLCDWILPDGKKITSYLWPFLEDDIPVDKYIDTLQLISELPPANSFFQIATHPWHLVETFKHGRLDVKQQKDFIEQLKSHLFKMKAGKTVKFVTISEYLEIWHSLKQREELGSVMVKV